MSTNHTTNYQLNQWEPTDQVLRTDFNADNAKIEAALSNLSEGLAGKAASADLAARNCQYYVGSYTGDGEKTRTLTFSGKPVFIVILGGSCLTIMIQGKKTAYVLYSSSTTYSPSVTWGNDSVTLTTESPALYISNAIDTKYNLFAVLSLE